MTANGLMQMNESITKTKKNRTGLRLLILCAAVILIIVGLVNKDYMDVFGKAVMICMECIGIG